MSYSTPQVAKKLGLARRTLDRYLAANKIPAPEPTQVGEVRLRIWSDEDVERVRKILPKIANGRKTRYKKKGRKKTRKK